MDRLESVRAKLGRAEQHFHSAEAIARGFFKSDFYGIAPKQNTKDLVIYINRVEPVPIEFGLHIGDAAHNLRSALDHIAFAFANPTTEREEKAIQFPLISRRIDFKGEAKRRLVTVDRRARTLIERFQPYHRRKDVRLQTLGMLQAVSNWDKHRSLLVSVAAMAFIKHGITFSPSGISIVSSKTFNRALKKNAVIAIFEVPPEVPHKQEVQVNFEIGATPVFDDRMPKIVRRVSVLIALETAYAFIREEILPAFEKL